ncbi:MAG: cytochrome c oxidase subunit 3, partial [Chloroflexota bacterium]
MRPALAAIEAETPHVVTVSLGIWTFLSTEVLFFGGLFASYALYRCNYPQAFAAGSRTMTLWSGSLNTALLMTCSLFLGIAERSVRVGRRRLLRTCLIATMVLATAFLFLKGREYAEHAMDGLIPGRHFRAGLDPREQLYFFLYFAMTGLHAVHMLVGMVAIGWLLVEEMKGRISPERPEPVAVVAIYWAFVD